MGVGFFDFFDFLSSSSEDDDDDDSFFGFFVFFNDFFFFLSLSLFSSPLTTIGADLGNSSKFFFDLVCFLVFFNLFFFSSSLLSLPLTFGGGGVDGGFGSSLFEFFLLDFLLDDDVDSDEAEGGALNVSFDFDFPSHCN